MSGCIIRVYLVSKKYFDLLEQMVCPSNTEQNIIEMSKITPHKNYTGVNQTS